MWHLNQTLTSSSFNLQRFTSKAVEAEKITLRFSKLEVWHVNLNPSALTPGLLAKGSSAVAGKLCEQPTLNISPQAIPRCLIQETLWTHTPWAPTVHCTARNRVNTAANPPFQQVCWSSLELWKAVFPWYDVTCCQCNNIWFSSPLSR